MENTVFLHEKKPRLQDRIGKDFLRQKKHHTNRHSDNVEFFPLAGLLTLVLLQGVLIVFFGKGIHSYFPRTMFIFPCGDIFQLEILNILLFSG